MNSRVLPAPTPRFRPLGASMCAALFLLSGCLGALPAPGDGDGSGGADVAPFGFLPPLTLAAPVATGEPRIVTTLSGDAWVTSISISAEGVEAGLTPALLWKIAPDGRERRSIPVGDSAFDGTPFGGHDSDVLFDEHTRRLYVADMWSNGVRVVSTPDGGGSWSEPALTSTLAGPDRPWLVRHPERDFLGLVYTQKTTGVWLAKSEDDGRTFPEQVPAALLDETQCGCAAGAARVDPTSGRVLVPVSDNNLEEFEDSMGTGVSVALSDPSWSRFELVTVAEPAWRAPLSLPTLAINGNGTAVLVWDWRTPHEDGNGETLALWGAFSTDGGRHWSAPSRLTPPNVTATYPWVEAARDGSFVLAWYGAEEPAATRQDVAGAWHVRVAHVAPSEAVVQLRGVQRATEEPVHEGPLARELMDFLSAAFLPDGRIAVAYASDYERERTESLVLFEAP